MTLWTRRPFVAALALALLAGGASSAARAETTLQHILATKKLTVGTEVAFPPFEFMRDGKITGYGKDILDAVVADLGVELNQLDVPFQGILAGLDAKKFDFVATSVGVTPERAAKYAFTFPIAVSSEVIVKRADETALTAVKDLEGKTVGTQLGTTTEQEARKADAALKTAGGMGFADLKLYPSFPEAYQALASGELDAVVQSAPNAAVLVKEKPGVFGLAGPVSQSQRYIAWVCRPGDDDLRARISSVIKTMNDNGKLAELQKNWFGFTMTIPDNVTLPPGAL
ncbi:transporter substrate-binding domain-containing protein [Lichenifustis flavocetrariae]|uniref:Transporter substrate-binding domain-containing protein n=1 Tax=Lichenifustis flavocetrariae TaxID=2949735 RepID=A0AA41Z2J6_9HYPH|nr:transporter substrate-binding domain-containing protein [Lichenifustis flavocetrariae]MCW6511812.1 transporter substrate-binding domain-containing protein [Lichenifustis flavocetrariae]